VIAALRARLFSTIPDDTLYHYTSLQGLMGIVESRTLRASDIRYMNDSTELIYALNLLQTTIASRTQTSRELNAALSIFSAWLREQINVGPMLFSASFRANGNLLSQWRGYSNHGKGVSLGFNPRAIKALADEQDFSLGKCLYNVNEQQALANDIVSIVVSMHAERPDLQKALDDIEGDLLGICALLKHPSFAEEQEWRLVSPAFMSVADKPIAFREGKAMLVPHYLFNLATKDAIALDHVYVGPTPNSDLSVNALSHYLKDKNAHPARGISDSEIPYRPR